MNNCVHVLPVGDIKPHIESAACSCQPRVEMVRGGTVVVHNAWDGREFFEDIEEQNQA